MRWVRLLAAGAFVAGCTGSSTPATAPSTVPTTTTTTTTVEVTTTLDRLAEIEAIYQDLDEKRLDALFRGDTEAFASLFANESYLEESLAAFDVMSFDGPPTVTVDVLEVVTDEDVCLAAWIRGTVDGVEAGSILMVLEPLPDGGWGYAFGGEGWLCVGPHPLES